MDALIDTLLGYNGVPMAYAGWIIGGITLIACIVILIHYDFGSPP